MADTSVHPEEYVLPAVPIGHWRCALPWGVRALVGYDKSCVRRDSAKLATLRTKRDRRLFWQRTKNVA